MGSGRLFCVWLLTATAGCNQVFGLDPPAREVAVDGASVDSGPADASSVDAPAVDAAAAADATDTVIDARPVDARTDACVIQIDGNECTYDTCGNPPVPRNTLCNGGADQCDGEGNCVDCTTSGGCGECCTCSIEQVCIPA